MFSLPWKKKPEPFPGLTPEQDAFLGSCTREYNEKLEKLNREWNFSNYKSWGFDQTSGLFFLELHDGSRVEADAQIIGSYMATDNSWEWAWNNPNVEPAMKQEVMAVRAYGEREKIPYLRFGKGPAQEMKYAIYLSSIAMKITSAEGMFAGNTGQVVVFISLKNLRRR